MSSDFSYLLDPSRQNRTPPPSYEYMMLNSPAMPDKEERRSSGPSQGSLSVFSLLFCSVLQARGLLLCGSADGDIKFLYSITTAYFPPSPGPLPPLPSYFPNPPSPLPFPSPTHLTLTHSLTTPARPSALSYPAGQPTSQLGTAQGPGMGIRSWWWLDRDEDGWMDGWTLLYGTTSQASYVRSLGPGVGYVARVLGRASGVNMKRRGLGW